MTRRRAISAGFFYGEAQTLAPQGLSHDGIFRWLRSPGGDHVGGDHELLGASDQSGIVSFPRKV
jgi:hypothetical protein